MRAAVAHSYDELLARHQSDHRALFRRVSIDLGTSSRAAWPTDARVFAADKSERSATHRADVPVRALSPDCLEPPGDSRPTCRGSGTTSRIPLGQQVQQRIFNAEMNYWPAEVANLPECAAPLLT